MNARRPWLTAAMLPSVDPGLEGGGGPPGQPGAPAPAPPSQRTFTQAEVNDMMARQAREGSSKLLREQFGVDSLDAAKQLVDAARKAQNDQLTDQQRATKAAEDAKTAAEQEKAAAAAERALFRKQSALMTAGMPLQVTDAAGKLVDNPQLKHALRLLDVDAGADQATVAAAVTQLKTDLPALFAVPGAAAVPAGNPGAPPRTPAGGTPGALGKARAERYAQQPGSGPRQTA